MSEITEFVSAWREKKRWEREYLAALERIRARIGEIYPESEIAFKYRFSLINSRSYKFQRIMEKKSFFGITYRKKEALLSVGTSEYLNGKGIWLTFLKGTVLDKKVLSIVREELFAFSELERTIRTRLWIYSVQIERDFPEAHSPL